MVRGRVQSTWTMCSALGQRSTFLTAPVSESAAAVSTTRTPASSAEVRKLLVGTGDIEERLLQCFVYMPNLINRLNYYQLSMN